SPTTMPPLLVLDLLARRAADRPRGGGTAGGRDLAAAVLAVVLALTGHLGTDNGDSAEALNLNHAAGAIHRVGSNAGQLQGFGHFVQVSHDQTPPRGKHGWQTPGRQRCRWRRTSTGPGMRSQSCGASFLGLGHRANDSSAAALQARAASNFWQRTAAAAMPKRNLVMRPPWPGRLAPCGRTQPRMPPRCWIGRGWLLSARSVAREWSAWRLQCPPCP